MGDEPLGTKVAMLGERMITKQAESETAMERLRAGLARLDRVLLLTVGEMIATVVMIAIGFVGSLIRL